jgi:hypothetical protein
MRKVQRSEILDYQSYSDGRESTRAAVLEMKKPRRIHLGSCLTFLFENTDTIRYQIQEMMRVERIVRESDIQQELATYNAVLGDAGELGCCLLIEIDDRAEREKLLRQWRALPAHVYLRCDDGTLVRARYDLAQMDDEKISAVQYLKFPVGSGRRPVAVGCDLPALTLETGLSDAQRDALLADLAADPAR